MIFLIWLIPLIITIFVIGDAIAEAKIKRKPTVPWSWYLKNIPGQIKSFLKGYHFYTWLRRYSSNGLLTIIWFYQTGIRFDSIIVFGSLVILWWILWKILYLLVSKRLKIKKVMK